MKNVNESLSHTISVQLSKLVNSVQEATVAEVKYSLRENENNLREATDRFEEILNRTCEKFDTDMTAIEKKLDQKVYRHHTGYIGNMKETSARVMMNNNPEKAMMLAIKGMLPHNKLGDEMRRHVFVYEGAEHPHAAQKPVELKVK